MDLKNNKRNRVSQMFSVDINIIKTFKKICIDKEVKYSAVLEEILKEYNNKENNKPTTLL